MWYKWRWSSFVIYCLKTKLQSVSIAFHVPTGSSWRLSEASFLLATSQWQNSKEAKSLESSISIKRRSLDLLQLSSIKHRDLAHVTVPDALKWETSSRRAKVVDGSKINHSTKWKVVSKSHVDGGIGIDNFKNRNLPLLAKWGLRYMVEPSSRWHFVIQSIHGRSR